MNCKVFENQVWSYLEGKLETSVARSMEAHAQVCEQCRHAMSAAKATLSGVSTMPRFSLPSNFASQLHARLAEQEAPSTRPLTGWARWRQSLLGGRRALSFSFVPVISLLIVAFGWFAWNERDPLPNHIAKNTPRVEQTLSDEYAQACLQIHEQMTVSELAGDPTTDYLLMTSSRH